MRKIKTIVAFLMIFTMVFNLYTVMAADPSMADGSVEAVDISDTEETSLPEGIDEPVITAEPENDDESDVTFDLIGISTINRERISALIIDMQKEVLASSLALDTFTVHALNTNPRNGDVVTDADREISNIYVNSAPEPTDNPPESGQYLIIEMVWWGTDAALTSNDNSSFILNYTVTQNKALQTPDGAVEPGDVGYVQGRTINELIDKFEHLYSDTTPYYLFTPDNSDEGPQPLVLLLHGSGQGAANDGTVLRFQNNVYFAQPEQQEQYPSYVMMPNASPNNSWDSTKIDNIKAAIDAMIADGKVDASRIYVTGSSMGGGGTWSFINRYPDFFAAAMPICAGGTISDDSVVALRDLPIWGFVTRGDSAGLFNGIINTVNRLKEGGASNTFLTIFEENYIPRANNNIPADWNMTAWPHAAWLMAYNVHTDVARGGRVIDWLFDQQRNTDTSFDLIALNTINRERISTVVIDMRKEVLASSLALDTFTVHALHTNPRNGAVVTDADREISNIYVNTVPEQTDDPPESGQYLIIEMVYWGTDAAVTANDNVGFSLDYTVTQNLTLETADGAVEPGSLVFRQRLIKNDLIDQFARGFVKAPDSTNSTAYRLYSPEITRVGSDATQRYPLVVLLHGGGQGGDNECQMRFQNNLYFAQPEQQEEFPAYVLLPASGGWNNAAFDNIKVLIDKMIEDGRVDPDRVYITGSSMGGGGTWNFVQRYPDLFAAAVPICPASGITSVENALAVADIPIWMFVTKGDPLCWRTTMNCHNNYGSYLNNYKFTIFEENYIPQWDWDMSAWPHAAWLMAYDVHSDVSMGGRVIDWMFNQKKSTDTSFDLLAVNSINRERISTVVIDMRKEVLASSLELDTFTVHALNTNPRTGAVMTDLDREISKIYVNSAPELTDTPPESGQYLIIELVWWGTDAALTSNDNAAFSVNYTVTQNKAFDVADGAVEPGSLSFKQRLIKNDLIGQFSRGFVKAPDSTNSTAYRLYSPELTTTQSYPLVVLLHGGGQGGDNETQMRFQNNLYFAQPEQQEQYPAYVLIPASGGWSNEAFDNLKHLIDKLIASGKVDATRIYVTGSSMGGGGTWNFIQRYPDLFAAAMPICAGAPTNIDNLKLLADLPIWQFITRGEGANSWNNNINFVNNYSQYLNNYKHTIFEENYIPRANNNIPADWDMTAWPHAAWLMVYNVHSDIARGGRVIDWLFAQQKNNDTAFDLLAVNTLNFERISTVVVDMRKDVLASSLDLDTFTVHALTTNSGAIVKDVDREISKVYVNTAPETTDNPPDIGQYLIIEMVYWGTEDSQTSTDRAAYKVNYTVTQNKAFQTSDGAVEPGDLVFRQRQIKNDLIEEFVRGYVKAPDSVNSTAYRLYSPEITRVGSDATQRYPLVVLLHGGGQGGDNEAHMRFHNNLYFSYPEVQEEFPAYVLMPANATNAAAFDNVKHLIDKMIADGRVDPDRVYITGSSMGGAGTWNFIQRYPDLFAAAVPICAAGGISSVDNALALADLPIWAFVTRGDFLYAGNQNNYDTYSPYMNDYKFTVFEENFIPAEYNRIVGVDWDMTMWPHAAWLMVYNVHVDEARGRMIDWMFAQSKSNPRLDVSITSTISKIVAGCAANLPAYVTFTGEVVPFTLGLYGPDGALIDTLEVTGDGKYTFKLSAEDTVLTGKYVIQAIGAYGGIVSVECVAMPDDIWVPVTTEAEGVVTITFAADVSFNEAKKVVKNGTTVIPNNKVVASGNTITITGAEIDKEKSVSLSGVKYPELFPSYSFTFTVTVP